jgi:hypothetical protein
VGEAVAPEVHERFDVAIFGGFQCEFGGDALGKERG